MRALISVWDKTGLDGFVKGLDTLGWELVASGGTAAYIEELGVAVTPVESVTAFPEMLGGRVKTLHPNIHAGILARREVAGDLAALDAHGIPTFDLVCVNLYPFEQVAREHGVREEEAVEMIDVGGPSMLRGAAKNFAHVTPVCRPGDYELVLGELRESGEVSHETRRRLAATAFATSASYEAAIATWFAGREAFPPVFVPVFEKALDLAYGENPHQGAAYYSERGARTHLLARVEQLHGRELSFNNLNDLNAARMTVREFTLPACVIVKHANPCGVAVGASIEEAYDGALAADPISAYGGVVVLNRAVSAALGERLAEQFVEVLFAPGYDEVALEALIRKQSTRVLNDLERRSPEAAERDYKRVLGGLLVQDRDWDVADREGMQVVVGQPSETTWGDLLFAWRVSKHVTSNAIVLAKDLQTDRHRRRSDESRRRRPDRRREGDRAGPLTRRRGTRLGCVLPLPGRAEACSRCGCVRADPARRLEARLGRGRGGGERRRLDGLHRAPALPALSYVPVVPPDDEPNVRSPQPRADARNEPAKQARPRPANSGQFVSLSAASTNSTTAASSRITPSPKFIPFLLDDGYSSRGRGRTAYSHRRRFVLYVASAIGRPVTSTSCSSADSSAYSASGWTPSASSVLLKKQRAAAAAAMSKISASDKPRFRNSATSAADTAVASSTTLRANRIAADSTGVSGAESGSNASVSSSASDTWRSSSTCPWASEQ